MDSLQIDREIVKIERMLKILAHLKPINMAAERELFLNEKRENPVFEYPPLRFESDDLKTRLSNLKPDDSPLGKIFSEKIVELNMKIKLLGHRGEAEAFTKCSEALYGTCTKELEDDAYRIIKTPHRDTNPHKHFNDESLKKILEEKMKSYGLTQWKVKFTDHMTSDIAAGKRNMLFVRRGIRWSERRVERIIAHEIETHILTAENGKRQPYKIFQIGLSRYLETQEGLAIYNQECREGCLPIEAHRISYLVFAVAEALRSSFRDAYKRMRLWGLGEEKSFRMAFRAKRGLADTGVPGAYTKDILYLSGLRKIEAYVKAGGSLNKLYIGKVSLESLPQLDSISELAPPRYLPDVLRFSAAL